MLRILRAQLDWFGERARASFVTRMADYLRREFPECVDEMSSDDLALWVDAATAKAEHYGIETEPEAAQLLLLLLLLGIDAGESLPWARAILEDEDLYPIGKVRGLLDRARLEGIDGVAQIDLSGSLPAIALEGR